MIYPRITQVRRNMRLFCKPSRNYFAIAWIIFETFAFTQSYENTTILPIYDDMDDYDLPQDFLSFEVLADKGTLLQNTQEIESTISIAKYIYGSVSTFSLAID